MFANSKSKSYVARMKKILFYCLRFAGLDSQRNEVRPTSSKAEAWIASRGLQPPEHES